MRPLYALVEGQTEELFIKNVLNEHLQAYGLRIVPRLVATKIAKTGAMFSGGVTSFVKFKNDMDRLLNEAGQSPVTTMLDYYRLPSDFPGMETRAGSAIERAEHVENAIHRFFGSRANLIPYLSLHEFEALLFSSPDELPRALMQPENATTFAGVRNDFATPELINERPGFSPAERIKAMFPSYRKTLHGPTVSKRIGLERLRAECPHFNLWVSTLEGLAHRQ